MKKNIEDYKEKNLEDYPTIVPLEKSKKINYQIENCICKIYINDGGNGTGFFCKIIDPKSNKEIPVMFTNNHIIGEDDINNKKKVKISFNNDSIFKDIKLENRKMFTNEHLDITIIEIKPKEDNINISFLEIDERIYQDNSEILFKKNSVYIIQYPRFIGASVSYGLINEIDENYEIHHFCITSKGSSGSPIILIENNKVIGVHKGHKGLKEEYNQGIFLKLAINLFFSNKKYEYKNNKINQISNNKNDNNNNNVSKNEIKIILKIEKSDVNKEIYFLDNTSNYLEKESNKEPHKNLPELNINNTYLFINKEQKEFKKYFIPEKEGNYEIILKFKIYLTDCSYMFYYCKNILKIDFSNFHTNNVNNMSNMFCYCTNLLSLDLSNFKTQNVKNMSDMFSYCSNLKEINLSSFNIQNVNNMKNMFSFCNQISYIDISSFIPSPNLNCKDMFKRCWNLKKLKLNNNSKSKFVVDNDEVQIIINK